MSIASVPGSSLHYMSSMAHSPPTTAPAVPASPAKGRDAEWNNNGSVGGFSIPSVPTAAQAGGLNITA